MAAHVPLPATAVAVLTIKMGAPLGSCRDKGVSVNVWVAADEGYGVLRAKVKAAFDNLPNFEWKDDLQIFIKPSNHAPQKAYIELASTAFKAQLESVWKKARLRRTPREEFAFEMFVYVPKPQKQPTTTLHRASADRVERMLPIVQEHMVAHAIQFGPATLRYAATTQARLPDNRPVEVPNNRTFMQLQHVDRLEAQHRDEASRALVGDADEYAPITIKVNNFGVSFQVRVNDIRRALGLPSYPLCPPYREPAETHDFQVPTEDIEDMEDVDHELSDEGELV